MKARNGILTLLAALTLAGCSVDGSPTELGSTPRLSHDATTTASDTTGAVGRGITTLGSGN